MPDEWDAKQRVCIWCLPKRHPDTGELIRPRHDVCVGRHDERWCECLCLWLRVDVYQHFPSLKETQ